MAIVIFILILSLLVMLHEFGHFLMAKKFGIGVEEFGIGIPPRIWGKKIGETIYSVNWLPFGGFVRLVGEDPTDKRKNAKNSFFVKKVWMRALVVLAGVFVNFAIAVGIFYFIVIQANFRLPFMAEVPISYDFKFLDQQHYVFVAQVNDSSPASEAGVAAGDLIVAVNGQNVSGVTALQEKIKSSAEKPIELTLKDSETFDERKVLAVPKFNETIGGPAIGVGLGEIDFLVYKTWPQKIFSGFIHSYNLLGFSTKVMGRLIGEAINNRNIAPLSGAVSGPVGIAQASAVFVNEGFLATLSFAGLLSLNLAILNVLPIPALDGGRFFFIVIEIITRKRVYPGFEKWAHTIGFVVLIGLIILVTFNDLVKLFH